MAKKFSDKLDSIIEDVAEEHGINTNSEEEEQQHNWISFNWTNESYQLLCREYRQSLGIVNMVTYECDYETFSEVLYWVDLYNRRQSGRPYIPKQVIADPPVEYEETWVKQHGLTLRYPNGKDGWIEPKLTPEQQMKYDDFERSFTESKISIDDNDVITDTTLIHEFITWTIENGLVYDLTRFNPSFAYLNRLKQEEHERQMQKVRQLVTIIPGNSEPEAVEEEKPTRQQEQPQQKPITATITTTKDKEPELVWSDAKGGFVYR